MIKKEKLKAFLRRNNLTDDWMTWAFVLGYFTAILLVRFVF